MNDFERITDYLNDLLDTPTFEKWIQPLSYIGSKNKKVCVALNDKNKISWIRQNLLNKINGNIKEKFNLTLKLIYLEDDDDDDDNDDNEIHSTETLPTNNTNNSTSANEENNFFNDPSINTIINNENKPVINSNIDPSYTFSNFVQVDQNRMACSFSMNVSEFPAKSYNPLYIYGDVGLGKTHLMNAIGNRLIKDNSNMRVIYTTSSEFMHEYVEYNRLSKRTDFINKYTSIDILLIDDIQYITKWGGTSEQFYYIFNKLIQMKKQIVICSDKHPDNIPDLEHRIKSRFEWGAIVDILPYDLEGRLAIIKNKMSERKYLIQNNFNIPEDVLYYIASSIKDNVRKLEGALNRLIGYANLKYSDSSGKIITLEFAKEALKPIIPLRKKEVTIDLIQEYVSKKFNIKKNDLVSKSNKRDIAYPRQIAMYITKKLTNTPLNEIGSKFGGKHHTTVLHSIKKVETEINKDPDFSRQVDSFVHFLQD